MSDFQTNLESQGFDLAPEKPKPRLIMGIQGEEGSGKNHLACTAPDPIVFQSTDIGLEGMVEKFRKGFGDYPAKDIYVKHYEKPAIIGDLTDERIVNESVSAAERFIGTWEEDCEFLISQGARTVVWDTGSELWQYLRWARGGRMEKIPPLWYAKFNEEYMRLVQQFYDSDTNLIILYKVKDEWANDKKTGFKERQGMKESGYLVQVDITLYKEDGKFQMLLDKCRPMPELEGFPMDAMNFMDLAQMIYPDVDEVDWMV